MSDLSVPYALGGPVRDLNDLIERFWRFCRAEISPEEFGLWLETENDLAGHLDRAFHQRVLENDYGDPEMLGRIREEIWRWIHRVDPSFAVRTYGYMASPLKAIRFDSATCTACGGRFPLPSLGSFSYGRVILTSVDGRWHLYLESLANPIFDAIRRIANELIDDRFGLDEGHDLVMEVVARSADAFAGTPFTSREICPICRAERSAYLADIPLSQGIIPVASFRRFNLLTDLQRRREVGLIISSISR